MPDRLTAHTLAGSAVRAAASDLLLAEATLAPDGADPPRYAAPLHIHRTDDEAFYVLQGTLSFRVNDDTVTIPSGGATLVPRGTAHTFWNPELAPARYLVALTPRISDLVNAVHAAGPLDDDATRALFERYEATYLGWP
jgi:mannose-6-phosphate isomerase-like protein (cupin superfamily)